MNYRLQQFLSAENITQAQFADILGVARASVSHILAGRNKPGFDFIQSMAAHYPDLNLEWLITGKGRMYKEGSAIHEEEYSPSDQSNLFTSSSEPQEDNAPAKDSITEPTTLKTNDYIASPKVETETTPRSVKSIVVFYDDGTYQELT